MRRLRPRLMAFALTFALGLCPPTAAPVLAQAVEGVAPDEPGKRARGKRAASKRPRRARAEPRVEGQEGDRDKPTASPTKTAPGEQRDKEPAPKAAASFADSENVRKEGDTEVKTVEFTGLDIDGQLKTPQLLYFLTRLRAEFDRPRLPHRSFMPELSQSAEEKALR